LYVIRGTITTKKKHPHISHAVGMLSVPSQIGFVKNSRLSVSKVQLDGSISPLDFFFSPSHAHIHTFLKKKRLYDNTLPVNGVGL
jgi:hypothetical protein